jgi:hypothetical protein
MTVAPPVVTTLDRLYGAILATLRATYGARFVTYAPYDPATLLDPATTLSTPALYLEIEEQGIDEATAHPAVRDRVSLRLAITAHVILSTRTTNLQIALDVLACSVLILIRQPDTDSRLAGHPGTRWGLGAAVTPAARVAILQTEWQPGLNGYGARQVRWEQTVYLPDDPLACLGEDAPGRILGGEGA